MRLALPISSEPASPGGKPRSSRFGRRGPRSGPPVVETARSRITALPVRGKSPPFLPLAVVCLGVLSGPSSSMGQVPPDEPWRRIETEHFRIVFPSTLEDLARRLGHRAEAAWELLSRELPPPSGGKIDVVLSDHVDLTNGFAGVFPSNRIYIYAPPPMDLLELAFMDEWLELVMIHELVHIFHLDHTGPVGEVLRRVMGRLPLHWLFFPHVGSPTWLAEGMAMHYESALTQAGRLRGTYHDMILRSAALAGTLETIGQVSGSSPVWPGAQRYYSYGSFFIRDLVDRRGPQALGRFLDAMGGQWLPYRLDAAAREAFGESFSEGWERWRSEVEARARAVKDSLIAQGPLTQGEVVGGEGYYHWNPAPSPDGEWLAYLRYDGKTDPQIRLWVPGRGEERKLTRVNSLAHLAWTSDGRLLFSQLEFHDPYRLFSDLYSVGRDGRVERLTRGMRLDQPHVAPDGARVAVVQGGGGTTRLVVFDLRTGDLKALTDFRAEEHWAFPRWSPDGRWIAAVRWRRGGWMDLVLLSPQGEVVWEVTQDRAVDITPAWSPDGRWLVWSSDRSRIPNLYAVELEPVSGRPGSLRQVTRLVGGAVHPAVDPGGRWLYFSSYGHLGWRVERIPFQPERWSAPSPLDPSFVAEVDITRYEERFGGEAAPYRSLPTLLPRYWAPALRAGDVAGERTVLKAGFGIRTSGRDLVGRHGFNLEVTVAPGPARWAGGVNYTFSGLGNPLLSVGARQSYNADSRILRGVTQQGDTVPLYLVEKERALSLASTLQRRRAQSWTAFTLGGSYFREDRILLENDLRRSSRFALRAPRSEHLEGRAGLGFRTARVFPFSVGREDGVAVSAWGRVRKEVGLADTLRGRVGWDGSFQDVMAAASLYRGIPGPGFGRHGLAFRLAIGRGWGPGAGASHFEVGGASGVDPVGVPGDFGGSLWFPVRGYATGSRFGRTAWTGTLEYRFPLAMLHRGFGLAPLHLGWLAGTLFFDAGNAWGPEEAAGRRSPNPRRSALASVGGEAILRFLPLWLTEMDLRVGVGFPLVERGRPMAHLRFGSSF